MTLFWCNCLCHTLAQPLSEDKGLPPSAQQPRQHTDSPQGHPRCPAVAWASVVTVSTDSTFLPSMKGRGRTQGLVLLPVCAEQEHLPLRARTRASTAAGPGLPTPKNPSTGFSEPSAGGESLAGQHRDPAGLLASETNHANSPRDSRATAFKHPKPRSATCNRQTQRIEPMKRANTSPLHHVATLSEDQTVFTLMSCLLQRTALCPPTGGWRW